MDKNYISGKRGDVLCREAVLVENTKAPKLPNNIHTRLNTPSSSVELPIMVLNLFFLVFELLKHLPGYDA